MKITILYIFLLLLCNTIITSEKNFSVWCGDGSVAIEQDTMLLLTDLNVNLTKLKKPHFPRYELQNNDHVECRWIPTMAYMKELIHFSVFDHKEIKKQLPLKTFAELCVMYHDYRYLCINNSINDTSNIEKQLISQFYREHRVKKEHWIFIMQYFSSKQPNPFFDFTKTESPTRDRMIAYWLSKMNQYKEKYILCNHENNINFYISNDNLYRKLSTIIKKYYQFYDSEYETFKRNTCDGILDLSDFELTDDVLYGNQHGDFNEGFFGQMVREAYPVSFTVIHLILDNNKITNLPLEMFIKCFPNMETLSVKNCPINQMPSTNDYAIFNYTRSNYLIILPPGGFRCDSAFPEKLMWNGRSCLSNGYNYENDAKPLTVITDNDFVLKSYSKVDCTKLILKKETNQTDEITKEQEAQIDKKNIIFSEEQLFVECSDGHFFIKKEELKALPGLNIRPGNIKKPEFSRYFVQNNDYVECKLIPTLAYMKKLIHFCMFDHKKVKKKFALKTFTELCVIYHDSRYLCINDTLRKNIEKSLIEALFFERRSKKEHWAFIAQYFNTTQKFNHRNSIDMHFYWLSQLTNYEGSFILCDNRYNQKLYIFIYEKFFKLLEEKLDNEYHYLGDEIAIHAEKICQNEILDLSDLELTNDILYKRTDRDIFTFDLHSKFIDPFLQRHSGVNFYVKKIILDNNEITKFASQLFIKHFPNVQEISVKGCPINQYAPQNDYAIFNHKRSDYLTTVLKPTRIYDSIQGDPATIMWDGLSCLRYPHHRNKCAYYYENDTRPLTIIADNTNRKYVEHYGREINVSALCKQYNSATFNWGHALITIEHAILLFIIIVSFFDDTIEEAIANIPFNKRVLMFLGICAFNIAPLKYISLPIIILKKYPIHSDKLIIKTEEL